MVTNVGSSDCVIVHVYHHVYYNTRTLNLHITLNRYRQYILLVCIVRRLSIFLILLLCILGTENVSAYSAVFNFNDYLQFYVDVSKTVTIAPAETIALTYNVTAPFSPLLISRVLISFLPENPEYTPSSYYYEFSFPYFNVSDTYVFLIFNKTNSYAFLLSNALKNGANVKINDKETNYTILDETDDFLIIAVRGNFSEQNTVVIDPFANGTYVQPAEFFTLFDDFDSPDLSQFLTLYDVVGLGSVTVENSTLQIQNNYHNTVEYIRYKNALTLTSNQKIVIFAKYFASRTYTQLGFKFTDDMSYDSFTNNYVIAYRTQPAATNFFAVDVYKATTSVEDEATSDYYIKIDGTTISQRTFDPSLTLQFYYDYYTIFTYDTNKIRALTISTDFTANKSAEVVTESYNTLYMYLGAAYYDRNSTDAFTEFDKYAVFYISPLQSEEDLLVHVTNIDVKFRYAKVNFQIDWLDKISVQVIISDEEAQRDFVSENTTISSDLNACFFEFVATNTNLTDFYIPRVDSDWFLITIYISNNDYVYHTLTLTKIRFDTFQEPLLINSTNAKIHAYINDYSNVFMRVNAINYIKIPTLTSNSLTERFVFYVEDLQLANNQTPLISLYLDNYIVWGETNERAIHIDIFKDRIVVSDDYSETTRVFNATVTKFNTFILSIRGFEAYIRLNEQIYNFSVTTNIHKIEYLFRGGWGESQVDVYIDDIAVYDFYVNPAETEVKLFKYYYLLNVNNKLSYLTFYNDNEFHILNLVVHYKNGTSKTEVLGTQYIPSDPNSIRQYLYLSDVREIEVFDGESNYLTTLNFEVQDEYYKIYDEFEEHFIYVLTPDPDSTIVKIKNGEGYTVYSHRLSGNDTIVRFTYPTNQYAFISIYINNTEVKSTQIKVTNNVVIITVSNTTTQGQKFFDAFVEDNKLYIIFTYNKTVDIVLDIYQFFDDDNYAYNKISEANVQTYSFVQDIEQNALLIKVELTVIDNVTDETITKLQKVISLREFPTTTQGQQQLFDTSSIFIKFIILVSVVSSALLFVFSPTVGIIFSYIALWVLNLTIVEIDARIMTLATIFASLAVLRLLVERR